MFLVGAWWFVIVLTQPVWPWAQARPTALRARRIQIAMVTFVASATTVVALFVVYAAWIQLRNDDVTLAGSNPSYSRTVLISSAATFLLYFLRHAFGSTEVPRRADPRSGFTLLMALMALQTFAGLLRLYTPGWDISRSAGIVVSSVALFLPIEWSLAWLLRALQQPAQRQAQPFSGFSLTAAMFCGRSPLQVLARATKDTFGLEIRGSWLAHYTRRSIEPLLLVLVLACWLSSAVVIVPVDSEAVRVTWGRFQMETLAPGLHLIAPWPIEHVRMVPVGRVQDFALGFDRDLGGPVLWTETHFAGESNLLVGNGEEVLTFNVPVHFNITDAVAAERTSARPGHLLASLAQRELLLATAPRDSFGIMTSERDLVSAQIHHRLQVAATRFRIGTRINYVGLKDIHPPVAVAPAYQEVISAQEQRRMMIDLAAANRITGLAEAESEAFRLRRQSESLAAERIASVAGEAAILTGKVDARRIHPELFDFRNRIRVSEEVIPQIRVVVTNTAKLKDSTFTLDLRDGANSYP
jgi:regulator of protease activity HflC (stomatin/prohibitin superfamily)